MPNLRMSREEFSRMLRFPFLERVLKIRFNDNLKLAVPELVTLLSGSDVDVRMVAGRMERQLFTNPLVMKEFKDAVAREIDIHLICAPDTSADADVVVALAESSGGKFEIRRASEYPPVHYVIVDSNTVFVEQRHPEGSQERRGVTMEEADRAGPGLASDFDKWWGELESPNEQGSIEIEQ